MSITCTVVTCRSRSERDNGIFSAHLLPEIIDRRSLPGKVEEPRNATILRSRTSSLQTAGRSGEKTTSKMTAELQINLHHSRAATATLCQKILADDIGVVLIQEP
nr:unnamed protein product [Callosobruchus analis]